MGSVGAPSPIFPSVPSHHYVISGYVNSPSVVQQFYESEVNNEYVIRGNAAVLKCSIPSFVADFVQVVSWQDEEGQLYGSLGDQQGTGTHAL